MDEELEVVNSIYEGCVEERAPGLYAIKIPDSPVVIKLSFPPQYPSQRPRLVSVDTPSQADWESRIEQLIEESFAQDAYIFTFIDEVRNILPEQWPVEEKSVVTASRGSQYITDWATSEELVDRKSVFIGRAREIRSGEDVSQNRADLLCDNRIARATHNIMAWRVQRDDGLIEQDCDDDGESAAGSRLLHLLNITQALNVMVIVSRWYGGVHLGPDRFKHINSRAREALIRGGFIK